MSRTADCIIVGSGASAVHAAWPLVKSGLRVLMLDVGSRDERYAPMIPDASFTTIRTTDRTQHRYFLGDRFEGVPFGRMRAGAQLTPPREFINRDAEDLTPVRTTDFVGMESLAMGGLASGWGAGVGRFTNDELKENDAAHAPAVTLAELAPHYSAVERRIGVSGEDDDLTEHLGLHDGMMPGLRADTGSQILLDRYHRSAREFRGKGFRMGVSRLAACSRELDGRGPHRYTDMDFWTDRGKAIYRPCWTLEQLLREPNFEYLPGRLVTTFREHGGGVTVAARVLGEAHATQEFVATTLVLAAGVFGTARIVLRSLGLYDRPVRFVCNPYTYAPCLNLNMLGKDAGDARHSLSQLTASFHPPGAGLPPMHVSIYSYRSLLTFKLMKESPLNARASLMLMRSLIPLFSVLGLHHSDEPTPDKTVSLRRAASAEPERLEVWYSLSPQESNRIDTQEKLLFKQLRRLGCFPITRVRPGHGSSIHYAGTFPMSASPGELQSSREGLLAGTRAVYLADGSLLPRLPAKGLTLTLMANADRVGTRLADKLGKHAPEAVRS